MDFKFTEEQQMFRDTVYRYAKKEIAPFCEEADRDSKFSFEVWQKLAAMGLLGLPFPEEYGGQGADVVTCCLASEALSHAGVDQGHMLSMGAHSYLCTDTIYRHGTEEQRRKYVPKLAQGEMMGCMGLTEPEAGSDAASVQTTAVQKGDHWVLNGSKTFITNAPIADVCVVYATVDKEKKRDGITAFIVEKDFKGYSTGKPFHKLGCRSSTTSEVFFDNCEVPAENVLGTVGKGFAMTHQTLEWDRSVLLAPVVGGMMSVIEDSAQYATDRKQFGKPIKEFQAIQHKIADMKVTLEIARLAIYRVATLKDAGHSVNHLQASIAKAFVGDWGFQFFNEAVQLFGGYGYIHEYPVERHLRDSKIGSIGGGTSEIQRLIISRFI
ncbi:MAG: acyl-CoA dehydrogenase [bacterium]|nr:acyl-CoA dehydrogenase [bacterium]